MVTAPKSCATLPLLLRCFLPGAREQQPAAAQPCIWSHVVSPVAQAALNRRFSLMISFQGFCGITNPVTFAESPYHIGTPAASVCPDVDGPEQQARLPLFAQLTLQATLQGLPGPLFWRQAKPVH